MVTKQNRTLRSGAGRLRNAILLGVAGLALLVLAAGRGDAGASATSGRQIQWTSVLVTTRALPASSVLGPTDVTAKRVQASDLDASLAQSAADVMGRRLLLSVPAHTPVALAMLGTGRSAASDTGRRIIRLNLAGAQVSPDVAPPSDTEVVASTDGPSAGPSTRSVAVVAVCRLLQLGAASATEAATAGGSLDSPGASPPAAADTQAVLDCAAADALRVLYAADFAHAVRLLAHPAGSGPIAAGEGAA